MSKKYRTAEYEAIEKKTREEYTDAKWPAAKRWRNRVGFPRLIAESAVYVALRLLRDVNAGIFRNDPAMRERLEVARDAAADLYQELGRQNWRRFEGEK